MKHVYYGVMLFLIVAALFACVEMLFHIDKLDGLFAGVVAIVLFQLARIFQAAAHSFTEK